MVYSVKNLSATDPVDAVPVRPVGPHGSIPAGETMSVTSPQVEDFKRSPDDNATQVEVTNSSGPKPIVWQVGSGPKNTIAPGASAVVDLPALPGAVTVSG